MAPAESSTKPVVTTMLRFSNLLSDVSCRLLVCVRVPQRLFLERGSKAEHPGAVSHE